MSTISHLINLRGRVRRACIHRGIVGTIFYIPAYCIDSMKRWSPKKRADDAAELRAQQEFDRSFNVNTAGVLLLGDMEVAGPNRDLGHYYLGTHPNTFATLMAQIPVKHSQFIFIDYGSGKGKALLLASLWPFLKVVGVEFAKPLHLTALNNVASFSHPGQQCRDIEPIHMDAAQYELPLKPLVIYLYNPFSEAMVAFVLKKIGNSLRAAPRDIWICYCHPYAHAPLEAAAFLELVTVEPHYRIYRAIPTMRK